MHRRLYKGDPLSPEEREELEADLIAFCDWELGLLGDVRGLDVLYAGGTSPLWIEGLSQRIGESGSLTVLDADPERVDEMRESLGELDPGAPVSPVVGGVFDPPFEPGGFDFVYSAGLFHELGVRENSAEEALFALSRLLRPGGRLATGDFTDSVAAIQIEHEKWEIRGREVYGIGSPEGLVALHERMLSGVWWREMAPFHVRHLGKLVLAEEEIPPGLEERIRREGYTRPATVYVEGRAIAPG
jgi:SAM-dependent methyltransferase